MLKIMLYNGPHNSNQLLSYIPSDTTGAKYKLGMLKRANAYSESGQIVDI